MTSTADTLHAPTVQSHVADRHARALRDLRISVTDRCNFRCPYCMPADIFGKHYRFLPKAELLTFEEIERIARAFVRLGTTKLRITGGEPLLRPGLPDLIARLAAIDGVQDLALTTNGYHLAEHVAALADAGLHRITVSLDSLNRAVSKRMNGHDIGPGRVLEGIAAAERVGLTPIKINCVVQRGVNDHTAVDLARHFKGTGHIVRFIEFMDVGTLNGWDREQVLPARELVARINADMPIRPVTANYRGEVANRYVYEDGTGELGVIASVTAPFCGDCTRARLSASGQLVTCLFARTGTDLRGPVRAGADDAQLETIVRALWQGRGDRYSEERAARRASNGHPQVIPKIEMYQIGG